jgi:hypothetical protein
MGKLLQPAQVRPVLKDQYSPYLAAMVVPYGGRGNTGMDYFFVGSGNILILVGRFPTIFF